MADSKLKAKLAHPINLPSSNDHSVTGSTSCGMLASKSIDVENYEDGDEDVSTEPIKHILYATYRYSHTMTIEATKYICTYQSPVPVECLRM